MTEKKERTIADHMLPPGTRMCRCGGCERYFGSLSGFDAHRSGPMDARRCMTDDELRGSGLWLDERGYWRLPARGDPAWPRQLPA